MKLYWVTLCCTAHKGLQLLSNKSADQTSEVSDTWLTPRWRFCWLTLETGCTHTLEVSNVLAWRLSQSIWFKMNHFVGLTSYHYSLSKPLPKVKATFKSKVACLWKSSLKFQIQSLPQKHGAVFSACNRIIAPWDVHDYEHHSI